MNRKTSAVAVMALSLVLAACSSGGGLGDIFGGGSNNASGELRGRVDYVDTASNYVVLTNVSGAGSMLSSSGGNTVRVYYDSNTPVEWQGRTYHPSDLERGDEVAVRVDQSGNNLYAQSMTVLYNSSGSGPSSGGVSGDTTVRGTVRYVDTSRRIIEVDRFGGGLVTLSYDSNTYVTFDNRNYRVEDLERGDEIEIRTSDLGSGRLAARDILVTRSVSSGNTGGTFGNDFATVRGTVRYVDQSRREIGIESTSWIRRFNSGAGTGSTMVLRYDANTQVEYNGRLYAPTNLEPGDLIEVEVANSGSSSYLANRIVVVRDVNVR